jgi:hypothetical protein
MQVGYDLYIRMINYSSLICFQRINTMFKYHGESKKFLIFQTVYAC